MKEQTGHAPGYGKRKPGISLSNHLNPRRKRKEASPESTRQPQVSDLEYEIQRLAHKLEIASERYQTNPTDENMGELIAAEADLNIAKRQRDPLALY